MRRSRLTTQSTRWKSDMTSTMNDSIRATPESETTSTTSLVEWTALPVLHSKAQSHGTKPGVENQLDENDALALRLHAERIAEFRNTINRTVTKAIIDIGGELSGARALLAGKGREGRFRPWCKRQGFSKSAVYRAIAAHVAFGKCPTVGHFDAKAVYLLSAESCPAAARAEAMRRAEQGNQIDHDLAKQIVAKFVPKTTTKGKRGSCRSDVEIGGKQAPTITTGTTPLEYQPEAEQPADEDVALTSDTRAVVTGDIAVDVLAVGTDDSATATTGAERQTGLAGLQTVIAALEDMGVYDEYRDVLDRIRVALEGNAGQEEENEETDEWTL